MKKLVIPSYKRAKVGLFGLSSGMNGKIDDKISAPTVAELSFNFDLCDGSLKDGVGVKNYDYKVGGNLVSVDFSTISAPKKAYFYKRYDPINERNDDRLMVYCQDGYVYQLNLSNTLGVFSKVNELHFDEKPNAVCYKYNGDDVIIFSTSTSLNMYDGEMVVNVEGVPDITSMCVHSERLFVTTGGEQTSLWFSNDFDPTNWYISLDEAGFIDFQDGRGRLLKVMSFNNYVYIFRNYGITRLSAYGDQTEFYATGLYLGSGRIYKDAIVDCGSRIIYLAEDGFYSFDGLYASRILSNFDKYLSGVDNNGAIGKFYNGKLYFCLKMKFENTEEKVVLVYDTSTGYAYVTKGLNICDLEIVTANEYSSLVLLVEDKNKVGQLSNDSSIFGQPLQKKWKSHFFDFGIIGQKVLAGISLYTKNTVNLTVRSELSSRCVTVYGSDKNQEVKIGLKGNTFQLDVSSSQAGDDVSKIVLIFNYF